MALVYMDGFDYYGNASAGLRGWNGNFDAMVAGRFGGQAAREGSGADGNNRFNNLGTTYSTIIVGFALNISTSGFWNVSSIFRLNTTGTTVICAVGFDASGHLQIKNNGGTIIATGTTVISAGVWNYVEVKLVINGASGNVTVNLNGVAEIAQTTGNFGSTNCGAIGVGKSSTVNGTVSFDDLYIMDTTGPVNTSFAGDVRIIAEMPTADGAHSQWTATGGGPHYTQVNEEPPDGDTTYVSDSTPGDIDTYAIADVDGGATVFGVQVNVYARKDDAATRQIAPVIRQASTDYVGTTVTMAASYAYYNQIYNQDPTSSNWTPTTFNADEFGVKEIA